LQDGVCPPATNFTLYNQVAGEKEYRVYPFAGHRVEPQHPDLVYAWIRKHFGL
jgi:cephalosporin-C deacetylase